MSFLSRIVDSQSICLLLRSNLNINLLENIPATQGHLVKLQNINLFNLSNYRYLVCYQPNRHSFEGSNSNYILTKGLVSNNHNTYTHKDPINKQIFRQARYIHTSQLNRLTDTKSTLQKGNSDMTESPFLPRRALILKKFSRLEFERLCHPNLSEEQLANNLSQRGSNYESLKHSDQIHKASLRKIESTLRDSNIEFETVDRFGYTEDKIDWADVIITNGGDGTFLTAASKINIRDKPVIGINSDPSKSVGSLCLPRQYSDNFDKVVKELKEGNFQWTYKQRLRITLVGEAAVEQPKDLNDIRYNLRTMNNLFDADESQDRITTVTSRSRLQELGQQLFGRKDEETSKRVFRPPEGIVAPKTRQLKERALNEVFIGEIMSARVSYYELSVDNNRMVKMKSSGLTVCTGTGSTSWYYNINKLTEQQVKSIVHIMNDVSKSNQPDDEKTINEITKRFNQTLTFKATEQIMAYSIRDPVDDGFVQRHSHRGFAKRVEVKSKMQDACLVLDGGQFYPFNDGSYAVIEMHDEDALKTISLNV